MTLRLFACAALGMAFLVAGCESVEPDGETARLAATPAPVRPVFVDITQESRLRFQHTNGMSGERFFVEMVGAGVALFDFDRDGDLDVFLVQGHALGAAEADPGAPAGDRLYRNDLVTDAEGRLSPRFTDVTEASGLREAGYGMGVTTGDIDNDGWMDLYVTNFGANTLWRNRGGGTFEDITASSGAGDDGWSTSASFLDYDRDGWLDLMIANYVDYSIEANKPCFGASGERDYCGPSAYRGTSDRLLHNKGNGTFEDVTLPMGVQLSNGPGLGVVASDLDRDGWLDIYVANDGAASQLWLNLGGERFVDIAMRSGSAVSKYGNPEAGMGVLADDFDNDGDDDLFKTHLTGEMNAFYRNDGAGGFTDERFETNLGPKSQQYTGFGAVSLDFDLDGFLDIFVANGAVKVIPEQALSGDPLPMRQSNTLYHSLGGIRFEDVTEAAGEAVSRADVSRGVATGDIDNDGDADLLVTNNNGPVQVLVNRTNSAPVWLGARILDRGRDALGAQIILRDSQGTVVGRGRVRTDGSYLSASDPRVLFGLGGRSEPAFDAHVTWTDGQIEEWRALKVGAYHDLVRGKGQ